MSLLNLTSGVNIVKQVIYDELLYKHCVYVPPGGGLLAEGVTSPVVRSSVLTYHIIDTIMINLFAKLLFFRRKKKYFFEEKNKTFDPMN